MAISEKHVDHKLVSIIFSPYPLLSQDPFRDETPLIKAPGSSARHDYDATAGSSLRSSSTGSVATGIVGFWGGAIPLCSVARAGAVMGSHQGGSPFIFSTSLTISSIS